MNTYDLEKILKEISEKYNKSEKIQMIQELRERTNLGLKEAKDIVENYMEHGTVSDVQETEYDMPEFSGKDWNENGENPNKGCLTGCIFVLLAIFFAFF